MTGTRTPAAADLVGQPIPPSANHRYVQGRGLYTDDHSPSGALHMIVVRSPHASADIRAIRTEDAAACPGVAAVLTGADAKADGLGSFKSLIERKRPDGSRHYEPRHPAIAEDCVRNVGFPVAIVIAATVAEGLAAAELVEVDYDVRQAVTGTADAIKPDAPLVWDDAPGNLGFVHTAGDEAAVETAMASARHVVSVDIEMTRVAVCSMEMRNAVAEFDHRTGRYTLWTGAQLPHDLRNELSAILGISPRDLRIISPDIGGAFGMKLAGNQEQILVLWAARRVGRPVRWQATRNESMQSDWHARDQLARVSLALDETGAFLALRVDTIVNLGAYLHAFTMHPPTNNLGGLSGPYRTPHVFAKITGVFSNKGSNGAYRGAGRPEASYAIERVIDAAARKLGVDRAELRRRNMIPPSAMPYNTGFIFTYDCGEFEKNLDSALAMSKWSEFDNRRKEALQNGKLRGIGLACAIEIAGGPQIIPPEEHMDLRFDSAGRLTVMTGLHSHGHGLETVLTQLLHDRLGVQTDNMRVVFGDTDQVYWGKGSGGSRSAAAASQTAAEASTRIIAKGRKLVAHVFEASEDDIAFEKGVFSVAGTDKSLTIADVARISFDRMRIPKGMDVGLSTTVTVSPGGATFPNGCHVCEVEIDPETGVVRIVGYWSVEDVGRVLNPLVADGQVHGGVVQGIGQALMEQVVYDPDNGQLLSASFMDYAMPRADNLTMFGTHFNEVHTKTNPFGAKGVGEAGTVAAIPTVMNAVNDALIRAGAAEMEMPATPERVWQALRKARSETVRD